ncbi:reverse transcriptase domain-containing protein [Tanacetum coccineum]
MSGSPESRRSRSKSPREKGPERKTVFRRLEKGVFHRLVDKEKSVSAHSRGSRHRSYHSDTESCYQSSRSRETEFASEKHHNKRASSQRIEALSESEGSAGGHWKSKPKKQKSSVEDDMSQPWVCEETDPFTPRIRYVDFPKTRMPSHIKTYDGSEDPKYHLKIFQAAAKTERWESIDSYDDLRKSFLENYLQQKKYIKDPVEIHNIKQRDGESTEEFVCRYKLECTDVKGAPECMKISRFIGEVEASNREWKKSFPSWKQQEVGQKQNFKKGGFWNQQRTERKQDRFTLLTKTPKEILALDKGMFKPPSPMTTPVEKRNASKFCEFHGEVRHTTDECMNLKRQIEEMLKARKLSHLIKELKQRNGKDQTKAAKKGETLRKDKSLAILMVQPWQRVVTLSLQRNRERTGVRRIWAVPSTAHGMLKFPVTGGTVTLRSSRIIPLECTMDSGPGVPHTLINQVTEEKIQVAIHPEYPKQTVAICSTLTEEGRKELCSLLRRNLDIFAWKPADMTGVP